MMNDKFDTEFKRKVKGIIPEVPDVVSLRIDTTLASLPSARRNWRRAGFSSAAAALFLICFIGIRYLYPPAKKDAPIALTKGLPVQENITDKKDYGIQAADQAQGQEAGKTAAPKVGVAAQLTVKNTAADTATSKTTKTAKADTSRNNTVTTASNSNSAQKSAAVAENQGFAALAPGNKAENQGIQLIMKSVVYDGKVIRIGFDRIAQKTEAAGNNKTTAGTSGENVTKASTASITPFTEDYSVKVIVDGIPLKCTINTEGSLQSENQYSGNIIITPDGELPQEFNISINIDKIGDVPGAWEINSHVVKTNN